MIIAADPGKDKTGVAFVEEEGSLVWKKVVPTTRFEEEITPLLEKYKPGAFIMGNGTQHEIMKKRAETLLKKLEIDIPVILVNEKYTTEMGEKWYWKDHPAKGFADSFRKACAPYRSPLTTMWPGSSAASTWEK